MDSDELRGLGAKSLALFGSMARGEGSDSSDIDMLVELQSKTFDAYMDVKLFLEKILGRKVDLVLADAVKPRLRSAPPAGVPSLIAARQFSVTVPSRQPR